jgi:hypothetical protein
MQEIPSTLAVKECINQLIQLVFNMQMYIQAQEPMGQIQAAVAQATTTYLLLQGSI